eukprot:g5419.t1
MTSFAISDMKSLRSSGEVEASVNALQAGIVEIGAGRLKKAVKRAHDESSAVDHLGFLRARPEIPKVHQT